MSNPIRVVGAVFHDGERFLACRKKPGKPLEGHWEFPGGKIEPGETPEQALAREIREELNLIAEVGQKVTTTTYEYEFATIELTTFYCTLVDGDLRLTDHDATKWVTSTEAAHLAWAPADIPAVEAIASSHS
ncbi:MULTISPECIES: (deoxy)nucleoside triphosphate pyrophosphohydrolase [Corynebacterium]|uniref:8-oxo-dGTP diphosphatase n=1 Tax=Corynebacterium pseudogenitalium ATCC 33035 TaxID=525264 RepID=E2S4I4_9CORY|nr:MULTISPECIES: (deoxy)nucleoside triphosphate pyrophosphohydrolase [Corynebacterium]EFQ80270.1 mutator mutT protein [Corynebacterium pseudogenitalium ATCC 33035]MDK8676392.1 (deoxy)nucleoside triphosphate pyrophosphohydrolase [Corynebacterium tuberculostearicum]MDV2430241.1 (deoxy)nucleoside triphosphate pyrophosphohydrolase [Corynebacterium tuberculostearicum]MDV2435619.1 (deoxy)nucleoside triphosphate pyrophosphohydrolase [Corynebacterium tuberculostearicum]WKE55589.1 (deoxy)nucleoside tri